MAAVIVLVGASCSSGAGGDDRGGADGDGRRGAEPDEQPASEDTDGPALALFADLGPSDPFCTAAVRSGDEVVFAEAFGTTPEGPMTPDVAVDIASVSKQLTGVAVELLLDRGEISGDDLVGDLVPASSPATDDVTVDELLTHTSGLEDYVELLPQELDEPSTQADAVAAIAATEPTAARGSFAYSNSNYVLLAEVVEAVSGRPFPQFLDEEVFTPLELDMAVDPRGAWLQIGDGSVRTTPTELVTWSAQYWEQTLEGPDLVEVMFDPEVDADETEGTADELYGSGVIRTTTEDGAELIFHSGSWDGVDTDWAVLPEERLAAAVTCSSDAELPTDAPAEELMEIWRS